MAEGFLGRWSQRKVQARLGEVLPEPPSPTQAVQTTPPLASTGAFGLGASAEPASRADSAPDVTSPKESDSSPTQAPVTLQDAQALGRDSDYRPFVARGVDPSVRNAAMKQLFADPHFNVMDRLDTYIDDYSQPDPLPLATLRQMASAQFLKLFDDEPSATPAADSPQPLPDHADPDLRLQQDHAARAPVPGGGPE